MMLSDAAVLNILIAFAQFFVFMILALHSVSVSRNQSAASLHCLLLTTFLLAFLLPFAHVYLPKFHIVLLDSPINEFMQLFALSQSAEDLMISAVQSALLFGFAYAGVNMIFSLFYLPKFHFLIARSSKEQRILNCVCQLLNIRNEIIIGYSSSVKSACTWGLFRPRIALPMNAMEWSDDTLQRVLHHECCHIRRKDWVCSLLVNFARRVLWFVPLSAVLAKKIHWFAELACDDSVLKFWSRQDYADDLLMLAKSQVSAKYFPKYQVVNGLDYGEAYARIDAVLDPTRVRTGIPGPVFVLSVLILLGGLMLSTLRFEVDYPFSNSDQLREFLVAKTNNEKATPASSIKEAATQIPVNDEMSVSLLAKNATLNKDQNIPVLPIQLTVKSLPTRIDALPEEDFVTLGSPMLNIQEALVSEVLPEYPRSALKRSKEGTAQVEFDINTKGEPYNIRVIYSKPYASFGRAAADAVRQYRYTPKIEAGRAKRVKNKTEMFYFRLEPE